MKSYYAKYYYNSGNRNCRNYSSASNNVICHYVIRRSEKCSDLLSTSAPATTELYSDSAFSSRYDVVSVPSISDLNVISSNCSEVVQTYGGTFENYQDGYVGSFLGFVVIGISFGLLIWALIRRHF